MFSEYCENKFTVEPVNVIYEEDGRTEEYPDLSNREVSLGLVTCALWIKLRWNDHRSVGLCKCK